MIILDMRYDPQGIEQQHLETYFTVNEDIDLTLLKHNICGITPRSSMS